jgi:hypothetical protein
MQALTPKVDTSSTTLTYRLLQPFEYYLLAKEFDKRNAPLPQPHLSQVYAAFDGDRLVAFWVLQAVLHAEPLWIDEEYRGNPGLAAGLLQRVEPYMRNETVMVLAESEEVEFMLQRLGFEKMPYPAYVKVRG